MSETKLLFIHGPAYYLTLEDVRQTKECGSKTARAIWNKLPFVSMEQVMEYQQKKPRLYRMTLVVMTLARQFGSGPSDHYAYLHRV